jgi:hypothetical protein
VPLVLTAAPAARDDFLLNGASQAAGAHQVRFVLGERGVVVGREALVICGGGP